MLTNVLNVETIATYNYSTFVSHLSLELMLKHAEECMREFF